MEITPIVLAILGIVNAWLLYLHKSKKDEFQRVVSSLKEEAHNIKIEATSKVDKLDTNLELVEKRLFSLERSTITEEKAQELINSSIAPMKDTLEEIKRDSRETRDNINSLMVSFSHLLGRLDIDSSVMRSRNTNKPKSTN